MNRIRSTFVRTLALWLGFTPFCAAPVSADETPWYEVEIIVFAHAKESYYTSENWKQDLVLPQFTGARTLTPATTAGSKAFQALDAGRFRLGNEWSRLASSSDYRPLLHTAWLQPGLPREQAVGVILEAGDVAETLDGIDGAKPLSGIVKVGLSRYLHLDVNLLYRKPLKEAAAETGLTFDTFQLNESRRMRSKEIHYLDHPMFGVIALITPLQQ